MSYNPSEDYPNGDLRNPSGIVFFGKDPSKPMLDSASNFLVDEDNSQLKVPNILLSTGNIGVAGNTNAINIASNLVTFATGVQIEGDLVVNGTTVTVNTETVTIDDNILVLNNNAANSPTEDAGIEVERGDSNNVKIFWDESNDYWAISDANLIEYELATRSGVQEFLNKTIDGNKNTLSNIANSSLTNKTIGVSAGNGLTGGGTPELGGGTTLNVGAGNGITVAADSVSVTPGTGIVVNGDGVHVGSGVIAQQPFILGTGIVPDKDTLLILDSGVGLKQITVNELIAGADLLTEFTVSGATTTDVSTLSESGSLVFAGGSSTKAGITPVVSTDVGGNPVITFDVNGEFINSKNAVLDFTELGPTDYLIFYDNDANVLNDPTKLKKISLTSFADALVYEQGGPIMSGFIIGDGQNTSVINNGEFIYFTRNGNQDVLPTLNSNTNTFTFNLNPTDVTAGSYGNASNVACFTVDGSGRLTFATNSGIQIASSQVTDFGTDAESAIFTNGNFLDSSTIDFTVAGGTSVSGDVRAASIDETHINNSSFSSTGGLLGGSSTKISVKAGDAITVNSTGVSVTNDGITNAKLRNSSALSVIGRSAGTSGDPADIAAASDHQVLRRSGSSLGFGAINLASTNAVTGDLPYSNLEQGSALSVLGVAGNATADVASIAASTDGYVLRRSGTTLGFGQVVNAGIADDAVNGSKIADDSIDSEHYADLSIDTIHISNGAVTKAKLDADSVDGSKIEDNSIDSEHYIDGSIDTEHLSDGSVTEIKRYRTIQATSTSAVATGDIILCTGGSGGITITLPSVNSGATTTSTTFTSSTSLPVGDGNLLGRIIRIKKIDSGAGPIIIDGDGSETIDGALTKRLYYENESMTLVAYPSANGWYII